jgi:hypothetical protein
MIFERIYRPIRHNIYAHRLMIADTIRPVRSFLETPIAMKFVQFLTSYTI